MWGLSVLSESEAEQQASVLGGLWGRRCLWQRQQQGQACRLHRPGQNCQGSKHEYLCWGSYNLGYLRWPSGISSQLLDARESQKKAKPGQLKSDIHSHLWVLRKSWMVINCKKSLNYSCSNWRLAYKYSKTISFHLKGNLSSILIIPYAFGKWVWTSFTKRSRSQLRIRRAKHTPKGVSPSERATPLEQKRSTWSSGVGF